MQSSTAAQYRERVNTDVSTHLIFTSSNGTTTIEAKWLGACKADQKPGDIVMPGGMKMNIKDMEKLKDLIPKQK